MTKFADFETATKFRDVATKLMQQEIQRQRPRIQYAVVNTIDRTNLSCTVTYVGDSTSSTVKMGTIQPTAVGNIVRVDGPLGDRYISDVLGGNGFIAGGTSTGNVTVTGKLLTQGVYPNNPRFQEGIEIGYPAYIDFHRGAVEEATDYNVRLYNDASNVLSMYGTGSDVRLQSPAWGLGVYQPDWSYAHFGHKDWMWSANSRWQVLARNNGWLGINSSNGQSIEFCQDGALKGWVRTDGIHCNDWFRAETSGVGYYMAPGDGGWKMFSGDGWMYVHNNKPIFTDNEIRARTTMLQAWNNDTGHALVGHKDAGWSRGYMTRYDGILWVMYGSQINMRDMDGAEPFSFNRFRDIRLNPLEVAPGDPDLRIAGSNQLFRNPSNRRYKKNIKTLEKEDNPIWRVRPVRYHWKDDSREKGMRFNEKHPQGCPGFIAEELAEVSMDLVTTTDTGEPSGPMDWSIMAYTIAGLQELKERIETLEAK